MKRYNKASKARINIKKNSRIKSIEKELKGEDDTYELPKTTIIDSDDIVGVETEPTTSVVRFDEASTKTRIEEKAWEQLEDKITSGRASDKLIEMVLSPKFPKTNLNMNLQVDKMDRDELISFMSGFKKK